MRCFGYIQTDKRRHSDAIRSSGWWRNVKIYDWSFRKTNDLVLSSSSLVRVCDLASTNPHDDNWIEQVDRRLVSFTAMKGLQMSLSSNEDNSNRISFKWHIDEPIGAFDNRSEYYSLWVSRRKAGGVYLCASHIGDSSRIDAHGYFLLSLSSSLSSSSSCAFIHRSDKPKFTRIQKASINTLCQRRQPELPIGHPTTQPCPTKTTSSFKTIRFNDSTLIRSRRATERIGKAWRRTFEKWHNPTDRSSKVIHLSFNADSERSSRS